MRSDHGLRKHMGAARRATLGDQPTTHLNCMKLFGVARPGKTARDRAKANRTPRSN